MIKRIKSSIFYVDGERLSIVGWYWLGAAVGLYNGVVFTLLVQVYTNG